MSKTASVIVVDPIFRGSRLMYSAQITEALHQTGCTVSLLGRFEAESPHYQELFCSLPHRLHNRVPLPADAWYIKMSRNHIAHTLNELKHLTDTTSPTAIIFSGWNEFFPTLAMLPAVHFSALKKARCFAFDYSPHFWLKQQTHRSSGRFQQFFKRLLTRRILNALPELNFFVADERLSDPHLSDLPATIQHRYLFLPETAPKTTIRETRDENDTPIELLIVGGQNRRKGLEDILAALKHPDYPKNLRVRLVGRLGEDLEHLRGDLRAIPASRLVWEDAFLSEAEIRLRYEQCDFVGIPYTTDFHSTSSVLAWAAAHGKPVVATDHGLVGFRVAGNNLGLLYPSRNIPTLLSLLKSLPHRNTSDYETFSRYGRAFAESCSVKTFQQGLRRAVLGT